ncbi:hypothetical protein R6Q57_015465 [Mikania cordata]
MLRQILTCNEFDPEFAQKVVQEAIPFKAGQLTYTSDKHSNLNRWFVERAYKTRPIKMVEFKIPHPRCVVYLDLKREVCASLFPVFSEAFYLGGQTFNLRAECKMNSFGLYLSMSQQMEAAGSFVFDFEFASRSKHTDEFVGIFKRNYTFTDRKAIGLRNLFAIPWNLFIGEDSIYFINGVLHLKVELTKLAEYL